MFLPVELYHDENMLKLSLELRDSSSFGIVVVLKLKNLKS